MPGKRLSLAMCVALFALSGSFLDAAVIVPFSPGTVAGRAPSSNPIKITSGGTYSGNWFSADPNTPAITISTAEPVVIQNATISSRGDLIYLRGGNGGANVTVRNVIGKALDPGIAGKPRGRFLYAYNANAITVSHCTMSGVSFGVVIDGSNLTKLSISNNAANDMEDRASDGLGGLMNKRPGLGHFVIIAHSVAVNGGDISWNQVMDTEGKSSVEDVINIYVSHGSSKSDSIRIHDNYLQGMFSPANSNNNYTGSGIMMDGLSNDLQTATGFVTISNNQIVHTANAGIGIDAGHDVSVTNNSIVSCGMDSSGAWIATTSAVGVAMWNNYRSKIFFNNSISSTTGGLVRPDSSGNPQISNIWVPNKSITQNNSVGTNAFTNPCMGGGDDSLDPELQALAQWSAKLVSAAETVGAS